MAEVMKPKKCHRCHGTKTFNKRPCGLCKGAGVIARPLVFKTVTHVAERPFTFNGRVIQRCAACGEKLLDSKYAPPELPPTEGVPVPKAKRGMLVWETGDLVRVAAADSVAGTPERQWMTGHWNTDPLPPDSCIDLVE
jgi:hypothetical protein